MDRTDKLPGVLADTVAKAAGRYHRRDRPAAAARAGGAGSRPWRSAPAARARCSTVQAAKASTGGLSASSNCARCMPTRRNACAEHLAVQSAAAAEFSAQRLSAPRSPRRRRHRRLRTTLQHRRDPAVLERADRRDEPRRAAPATHPADAEQLFDPPTRRLRLQVRPGLSGLWQVKRSGKSDIMRNVAELDLLYLRTRSIWLDLQILWRTPRAVMSGGGLI